MLIFKNKKEAAEYLDDLVELGLLIKAGDGGYYQLDDCVNSHGKVEKLYYYPTRYKDGWGISEVNRYPPGTWRAPHTRTRVDLWPYSEYDSGCCLQRRYIY